MVDKKDVDAKEGIAKAFGLGFDPNELAALDQTKIERFIAGLRDEFPEYSDEDLSSIQKEVFAQMRESLNFDPDI